MKKRKIAYVLAWNCTSHLIKAGMHQASVWVEEGPRGEEERSDSSRMSAKSGAPLCTSLIICSWKPLGKTPWPRSMPSWKAPGRQTRHHQENCLSRGLLVTVVSARDWRQSLPSPGGCEGLPGHTSLLHRIHHGQWLEALKAH